MSDTKSSYGEPVDEPKPEGDVVDSAFEGLADAEAAGLGATPDASDPAAVPSEQHPAESPTPGTEDGAAPWYDRPLDETPGATDPAPAVTASEPFTPAAVAAAAFDAAPVPDAGTAPALQPIFVQAPEPPRPRSNRGAAGLIGLLAAVAFGVALLGIAIVFGLVTGRVAVSDLGGNVLGALAHWGFWLPVIVFFVAFWILGAAINRGAWGHWVVWGLLVGVASYGGYLLGQLFEAPFWQLTAREGVDLLQTAALAPLAIVSFVLGRELTIWFGAWVSTRGRRISELNEAAQREYERTLEAGPQLYQQ